MLKRLAMSMLVLVSLQSEVLAVHIVTICGESCNSGEECRLGNNLNCGGSSGGVFLNGGADLDLYGKTITCSGCTTSSNYGVFVSGNNSTIEDTVGGGAIVGAWEAGIECQGMSGSLVRKVRVEDADIVGINECRKVQESVVLNSGITGITNTSVSSTDHIRDNFVMGGVNGIVVSGSGAGEVDHNVVVGASTVKISVTGATSTSFAVTGNVFYGTSSAIIAGAHDYVMSGNVCGDPTSGSCATCVTAGYCSDATAPFVGP
jgi:hypothetical protein